jgi:glycosyltransferase involved in cell wall biosynthesis
MISIVTPTYNHQKFIGACIKSVLAQTYQNWEMIIIDDGSNDGTGDIVGLFGDERIKYMKQENKGLERLSETYNTALNKAKGDYIAILEGDDFWPPYKLELQVPDFEDKKIVLSFGYTQIIDSEGKPLGRIPRIDLPTEAKTNNPIGRSSLYMMNPFILTFTFPVSVVMRKDALLRIGGFQQPFNLSVVDHPTFLQLSLEGKFVFHDQIMGFWRRHEQSTTKDRSPLILDGVHQNILFFLTEKGPQLPISQNECEKIKLKWKEFEAFRWFLLGRWWLVDGEWEKARKAFKKGLTNSFGFVLYAGLRVGILLSYFHIDMERPIRLLRSLCRINVRVLDEYLQSGMIVDKKMI